MSGLSHDMVAHLWAHRVQGRGNNMYSDGVTVYSYGPHFPIARWITQAGRMPAVLFTTRSRSQTTERHKRVVLRARLGVPTFYVEDPSARPLAQAVKKQYMARLADAVTAVLGARGLKAARIREVEEIVREANACANYFGWRWRLTVPTDYAAWAANARAVREAQERRETRAAALRRAKREAERAERIRRWRAGESAQIYDSPDILLRRRGRLVETSHGVLFPLDDAVAAFPLILQCRQTGIGLERPEIAPKLGIFTIDRIEPDGDVEAGCHLVRWAEIERLARELNLIEKDAA